MSGGNTETLLCKDSEHPFLKLGNTLDDACGECMDKVFRYIYENAHLFPPGSVVKHGGAQLSAWASQYKEDMNQMDPTGAWMKRNRILFPTPLSKRKDGDFSFSGLKTHSIRYLEKEIQAGRFDHAEAIRFSFYFERAVVNHLIRKLDFAITRVPSVRSIVGVHEGSDS